MRRAGLLAVLVGLGVLFAARGAPAVWRGASSSGAAPAGASSDTAQPSGAVSSAAASSGAPSGGVASGAPSSSVAAAGASAPAALQVILLGTGYPRPDPERAGPATAVAAGGTLYLVDAGRGVVLRL